MTIKSEAGKFSIHGRLKSFVFAFNGLKVFFKTQYNSYIHLVAAVFVVILGFILKVNRYECCLLILSIGFVFVAEVLNTSIEFLTDLVSPEYNELAKKVKDVAAAGVLLSAIVSVIIGAIIFIPKIIGAYLVSVHTVNLFLFC